MTTGTREQFMTKRLHSLMFNSLMFYSYVSQYPPSGIGLCSRLVRLRDFCATDTEIKSALVYL